MTPRTWDEKLARKQTGVTTAQFYYAHALVKEHARSVRIVKAEIKRVRKNQYQFTHGAKDSVLNELQRVLELLQRGRTGRGR